MPGDTTGDTSGGTSNNITNPSIPTEPSDTSPMPAETPSTEGTLIPSDIEQGTGDGNSDAAPPPRLIEIDGVLIEGTPDGDRIFGNEIAQEIRAGAGEDIVRAGDGDDEVYGGNHSDQLYGGKGDDKIMGRWGEDKLIGGKGKDVLRGGKHSDVINGGDGDDQLFGGKDDDRLSGGDGNDKMLGHHGNDRMKGGSGEDWLKGAKGRDRLFGGEDDDTVIGGKDDDRLFGDSGNDRVVGGAGDDHLVGGDGDDVLFGRRGSDRLTGVNHRTTKSESLPGLGELDLFLGGSGADFFVLGNAHTAFYCNDDEETGLEDYAFIKDFNSGEGDVIELHGVAEMYVIDAVPAGVTDVESDAQAIFKLMDGHQELIAIVQGNTADLERGMKFV